jgi:uracil phosphoribosyltransferase
MTKHYHHPIKKNSIHNLSGMSVKVVKNPIIENALSVLRSKTSTPQEFRQAIKQIVPCLILKASKQFKTKEIEIATPLCKTKAKRIKNPIVFCPIHQSGLSMLNFALNFIPDSKVGYFGLQRNEITSEVSCYYEKLPNVQGANVIVLDPMLTTGITSSYAIERIKEHEASTICLVCIVASPEGIQHIKEEFENLSIITATIDSHLNEKKFIVPGLGDFGDRFNGTDS